MFLDIGVGILLSIFTSWFFDIKLNFFIVLLGIIFILLPDIDFLIFLRQKKNLYNSHREILHYPLIFIILGLIILFFNKIIGTLFILVILWHFIIDTIGIGWGVQWLWPFSKKFYKLGFIIFYKAPWKPRLPSKFLYIWKPEEILEMEEKYGDPNWIKNIYFKFNKILIIELFWLILSVLIFFYYFN